MLHPVDELTVELFLDGEMTHGRSRSGAVPVLLARRKPHDIARPDFLNGSTFALNPAKAGHNKERLPKRVCMPCAPRARLKGHKRA